jgi:hypothetical protein
MLPEPDMEQGNRRGCQLMVAALLLVAILVGVLAWQASDTVESDVATSRGAGSSTTSNRR